MPLFKQRLFARLQAAQATEGGDGGGGASDAAPDVQAQIDAAVAAATTGLANKNRELLGSLKVVKENLSQFDGIDAAAMKTMLKQFSDSEEAALLAKGDIDAAFNRRNERKDAETAKQIKAREDTIAQLNAKAAKLAAGKVSGALTAAASKAGALPEAMEDIVLRGQGQGWSINDDGDVVALRDGEVVLGKDGKTPLTPQEWADSLREAAPHLWPKAQGTGAPGASGAGHRQQLKGNFGGNKSERTAAIAARFPELFK